MSETDKFYAKTTRSMLASAKEVGAMPFLLFQYYLTWTTAPDGIRPPLNRIAEDLGIKKNAVWNLKNILIKKGWIREENGEIIILKSYRNSVQPVQKKCTEHTEILYENTEKMYEPYRNSVQPYYKDENEQLEGTKKEQEKKRTVVSVKPKPTRRKPSDLTDSQKKEFNEGMAFLKSKVSKFPDGAAQGKALKWMLQNGADLVQIQNGLERQIAEFQGRFRASYLSLQKDIFRWIEEGDGKIKNSEVMKNGQVRPDNKSNTEKSGERVISNRNVIAQLRELGEQQKRQLRGSSG